MSQPNILLIISDQMTAALTGVYGHLVVQAPNLERLAGNLPFTTNTWENAINNYIVWLKKEQRSQDALYALARLGEAFPEIKKVRDLQYAIYVNWTQTLIKDKNYGLAIAAAEEGLNYFPDNKPQHLKTVRLQLHKRRNKNC